MPQPHYSQTMDVRDGVGRGVPGKMCGGSPLLSSPGSRYLAVAAATGQATGQTTGKRRTGRRHPGKAILAGQYQSFSNVCADLHSQDKVLFGIVVF